MLPPGEGSPAGEASLASYAPVAGGKVQLRGCVTPATELAGARYLAKYPAARFQYAFSGSGHWRAVPGARSVKACYGPPAHASGCYAVTVNGSGSSVFYRITTPATTAFRSAASKATKARA